MYFSAPLQRRAKTDIESDEMTSRLLKLMRFHWGAILSALVCMLFIVAPVVAFPLYAGDAYRGININHYGTDEDFYLARAHEVLEGNGLGQPFLAEGKELNDPTFYKIEHVLLLPATLLGLQSKVDIVTYYNILNGVGVFVLVLLLYALMFALTKNRLLSVATATFVLGGHTLIYYKTLFYDNFNIYGRSIFPYAASIPFFAFVLLLHKSIVEKRHWLFLLGTAVAFGSLFYVYFYAWTFALALLGSVFLISACTKNWSGVTKTTIIGILGLLIAAPLLFSFYQFFAGGAAHIVYYFGASHTREFVMSLVSVATLVLWIAYALRSPKDPNKYFLLACILAGWVALEQQMISGRLIQYGHYYWYFVVPLSIIVGVYCVTALVPKRFIHSLAALLILVATLNTVGGQYKSFFTTVPEKLHDQEYAGPLQVLDALPYGVVLTGHGIESFPLLTNIYTEKDVFFNPSGLAYNMPDGRARESLLVYLALGKDSRKDPMGYLRKSFTGPEISSYRRLYQDIEGYLSGFEYEVYEKKVAENDPVLSEPREALLASLEKEHREKTASPTLLRNLLLTHNVRYVLWDKKYYPEWDLSVLEPLETISESGNVVLYSLLSD